MSFMKTNRFILFLSCFAIVFLTGFASYGQSSNKENKNPYANLPFKDRLSFGGNFGLAFGSVVTSIVIAPTIGYNVSPKFTAGLGPIYQYYKDNTYPNSGNSIYGGGVYGRYYPLDMIFLQTEFQVLNLDELRYPVDQIRQRVTIPVLFVGGGYTQRTANGSGIYIGILYDLIGDINSPYPNNINFLIGGTFSL